MTELRQRANGLSAMTKEESESFVRDPGAGLYAKVMIESSPQQHGVVLKLHVPILYTILPEVIQRIILSWSF